MKKHGDIRYGNHCGVRQLRGCYDRVLDIACASSVQRDRFDLQLASRNLDWLKKIIASVDRRFRVENDPDSTDMWRDLCEQFQPLLADRGFKIGESRYVSVRMRDSLQNRFQPGLIRSRTRPELCGSRQKRPLSPEWMT